LVDTAAGELSYAWPWFLPDGKHFIFTAAVRQGSDRNSVTDRIKLGSVDSTSSVTLYELNHNIDRVEYSNDGYILYVEQDNLMGLPFDADKLQVTGEPRPIAMRIGTATNTYAFSVSNGGTLLYQTNNQSSLSELGFVDRTGKKIKTISQLGRYGDVNLSPDGSMVAYSMVENGANSADIWIYDLRRNVPTRLTFDPAMDSKPVWSPDSKSVYFTSNREGRFFAIHRKDANGLGDAELVYVSDSSNCVPNDFTPDGTRLLFRQNNASSDIGILSLEDSNRVTMLANSPFFEAMARVSPDGRYVAYVSRESGRREVYVRKLDGTGGKWQISTEHAENPEWNRDGTELFYLTYDNQIMAVKVSTGENFTAEIPVELFKAQFQYPVNISVPYDVSADGQTFLINGRLTESDPGEIVVVENWAEEFEKQ
jgi:Tol biopolymer transport system component